MADFGSIASVTALQALSFIASQFPKINPPFPIYAVLSADTFLPLFLPDSWLEFNPKYEAAPSDYPVEKGAFAANNIARRPWQVEVVVTKTGSDIARAAWLLSLQMQLSNNPAALYNLISPNGVYLSYAIVGVSYATRQESGSNKLNLSVTFSEIPTIPTSVQKAPTAAPKSAAQTDTGQVYTNDVTNTPTGNAIDAAPVINYNGA